LKGKLSVLNESEPPMPVFRCLSRTAANAGSASNAETSDATCSSGSKAPSRIDSSARISSINSRSLLVSRGAPIRTC
jgi:hypothetical protein